MPFTFSHPAIVFPLKWGLRKWTSSTGLIVGSIVPDFEKFIKMGPHNTFSHSLAGVLWFNLPLAIIISFVFHYWVRDSLIQSLPEILRRRFYTYISVNWFRHFTTHFWIIALSFCIGIASHLFWDYWIGANEEMGLLAFSQNCLFQIFRIYNMPEIALLELVVSIGGIVFILFSVLQLPVHNVEVRRGYRKSQFWLLCFAFTGLTILVRYILDNCIDDFWVFTILRFLPL